jgi:hypothetical protein
MPAPTANPLLCRHCCTLATRSHLIQCQGLATPAQHVCVRCVLDLRPSEVAGDRWRLQRTSNSKPARLVVCPQQLPHLSSISAGTTSFPQHAQGYEPRSFSLVINGAANIAQDSTLPSTGLGYRVCMNSVASSAQTQLQPLSTLTVKSNGLLSFTLPTNGSVTSTPCPSGKVRLNALRNSCLPVRCVSQSSGREERQTYDSVMNWIDVLCPSTASQQVYHNRLLLPVPLFFPSSKPVHVDTAIFSPALQGNPLCAQTCC